MRRWPAHALLVVAADRLAEGEVFADVQPPFARFDLADPRVGGRPASPPPRAWSDFRNLEKTSRLLQGAAPGHRCRLGGRGATRAFADGEAAVPPISVISNVVSILHSVADCGAGWGAAVQPSSATSARHARQAVRMASKCNLEKTLQITSRRRGEAEVSEAESWRMFSRSNPQTSCSVISAPPRGSSSSSRRCNLDGQSPREDVRSRVGRSRPGKPVEWVCVCQSLVAAAGGPRRYWRARGVRPNAARSEIAPCLLWRACGAPHPPCRNVRVRSLAIPGGVVHAEADLAGHATGDDVACEPGGLGLRLSRLRGAVRKSRP